jgi:hypothetical protein
LRVTVSIGGVTGLRQLPTITFRAGRRQRRYMTFFVTCCLAAGVTIAVLVLRSHRGRAEDGAWIGLALLIVLAVLLFLVRAAHVTIGGNPDYERQVATIIEYWRAAAAR